MLDELVTLKLEKYAMPAEDLHWFSFSVILTAEGNRFLVVEKYTDLMYSVCQKKKGRKK